MEKENKRKSIVTITIGVLIMIMLVIGSTYAFFQLTSDETGNSASQFTGELEDIENYGNSFLKGGLENYHLKVNASDMAPSKIGTHYYGTTDENSDYNLERMNYEVSEVSIEGGVNNDNIEYTCTSELSITLDGSLTEGNVLQEGDGALYLSGSNIRLDQRKIDLTELIKSATQNEEGIKEYKKTITYIISKGNNGTLNVDFEIVNRNAIQNDISGKNINVTIKNNNLQCEVSGKKAFMTTLIDMSKAESGDMNEMLNAFKLGFDKQMAIEKIEFVKRLPSTGEIDRMISEGLAFDLTDTSMSPEKSVIGWLELSGNRGQVMDLSSGEPQVKEGDLYNLYIGSKETIYAKDLSYMSAYAINLKEIKFDNLNTSETTDMSAMFYYCGKLTTLDLSDFDTSQVTDMSAMFSLTSISLPFKDWPNFVTNKVTDMNSMFSEYQGTTLDLSSFNTSSVTNMKSMFYDCSNLTTLDLSSFTFDNVNNVTVEDSNYTFYGVSSSCEVKIKSSQKNIFESKFPLYNVYGREFTPTYVD